MTQDFHSWIGAVSFLNGGRNKNYRSFSGPRATEAIRGWGDEVAVRYHGSNVVTFYPDGRVGINLCGWNTLTTRARINNHLPRFENRNLSVYTVKGEPVLGVYFPGETVEVERKRAVRDTSKPAMSRCYCRGRYADCANCGGTGRYHAAWNTAGAVVGYETVTKTENRRDEHVMPGSGEVIIHTDGRIEGASTFAELAVEKAAAVEHAKVEAAARRKNLAKLRRDIKAGTAPALSAFKLAVRCDDSGHPERAGKVFAPSATSFEYTPFLPVDGQPGPLLPMVEADPKICVEGYHAITDADGLAFWKRQFPQANTLYRVELFGEIGEGSDKVVARTMRFIEEVDFDNP